VRTADSGDTTNISVVAQFTYFRVFYLTLFVSACPFAT